MPQELTLTKSIKINASTATVWEALTNPELIKQYFFGTECISDWKKEALFFTKVCGKENPMKTNETFLILTPENLFTITTGVHFPEQQTFRRTMLK